MADRVAGIRTGGDLAGAAARRRLHNALPQLIVSSRSSGALTGNAHGDGLSGSIPSFRRLKSQGCVLPLEGANTAEASKDSAAVRDRWNGCVLWLNLSDEAPYLVSVVSG